MNRKIDTNKGRPKTRKQRQALAREQRIQAARERQQLIVDGLVRPTRRDAYGHKH